MPRLNRQALALAARTLTHTQTFGTHVQSSVAVSEKQLQLEKLLLKNILNVLHLLFVAIITTSCCNNRYCCRCCCCMPAISSCLVWNCCDLVLEFTQRCTECCNIKAGDIIHQLCPQTRLSQPLNSPLDFDWTGAGSVTAAKHIRYMGYLYVYDISITNCVCVCFSALDISFFYFILLDMRLHFLLTFDIYAAAKILMKFIFAFPAFWQLPTSVLTTLSNLCVWLYLWIIILCSSCS